jgi:Ca-activated chloride channel family protein
MRSHTYSRFVPGDGDAVDLEALLEQLADFLLQSGFAGGPMSHPWWGEVGDEADRSLEALKRAILEALIESGQFTPEMLAAMRGEGDPESEQALSDLLDRLVQRLVEQGYLSLQAPPRVADAYQPLEGKGSIAQAASRDVQFRLNEKGIDFLGYKALRHILGSLGRSSIGSHDYAAPGYRCRSRCVSKPYEFGDTLNLDVNATLGRALARTGSITFPLDLDYPDLMVHQAEFRSSCATVLLLDTSHSMILYGEDRFTPAKKVALA